MKPLVNPQHDKQSEENMELVSVIIATYNGSNEIDRTINSVLNQDYTDIEIITIDGQSNDGTQDKINAFGSKIYYSVSEKDKGIGDAWNKGLAKCQGRYIAILNCGDTWPTDYVSQHMSSLTGSKDKIQYGTTYMTDDGTIVSRVDRSFDPKQITDGFGFIHTSVMTSKAVYDKVGPFNIKKRIAIDSDWMLRALRLGINLQKVPVHNYMATGGVSSRQWLRGQREYLESLVEHGFISHLSTRLKFKKWLQSHYLRLNLPKYKSFLKMQAALCFIAALNLFTRCIPFHAPRHLLLKLAGVRIAPGAVIHQGVRIMAKRRLSVGEGSIINRGTLIDNRSEVTIGKHVSIAHESRIYTTGHDCHAPDFGIQTHPVQIDDYAVLFAGAVIMPGVRIGRGAVVLPFSVVTKDVAPMTMVGGIPATFKSDRHSELKYRLDYSYWFAI